MRFLMLFENFIENASIFFQKDAESHVYKAKSAVIHQLLSSNIMLKLIFWIPLKKWCHVISDFYDLEIKENDYVINYTDKGEDMIDVHLQGNMSHRLERFLQTCNDKDAADSLTGVTYTTPIDFRFEMQKSKDVEYVYNLTEAGHKDYCDQMQNLIRDLTVNICSVLSKRSAYSITVESVTVHSLPRTPMWKLEKLEDGDLRLCNKNYKINFDIKFSTPTNAIIKSQLV